MNIQNALKNSKKAIILYFLLIGYSIIGSVVGFLTFLGNIDTETMNPNPSVEIGVTGIVFILLYALILITLSIMYLVYYIKTIIEANKDSEQTSFILLVVGIAIGIVALVGLFVFRSRLKDLEKESLENKEEIDFY